MPTPTSIRRPGGRSARVLDAVYSAVGELMGEGQSERLTLPMVAKRAGVNPTSLYRRWGDINALLEEVAVAVLTRTGDELPDTGGLAGDLAAWAGLIAEDIAQPRRTRYLKAMAAARTGLAECPCWEQRREQADRLLTRAADRGEAGPTAAQVLDHVIAPLYHHAVFGMAVDDAFARQLVADVLAMAPRPVAAVVGARSD